MKWFIAFLLTAGLCLSSAQAASLQAFTATYQVSRNGSALGTSRMTLEKQGENQWLMTTTLDAEHGLASVLGGKLSERSSFRVDGDAVRLLSYDYRLDSSIKKRTRRIRVDWDQQQVQVDNDGKHYTYPSKDNLADTQLVALLAGRAAAAGEDRFSLSVAGKKSLSDYHFKAGQSEQIKIPLGNFDALRASRTDQGKRLDLWFVPGEYGYLPVKAHQDADGDITMELKSYSAN